MHHLVMKSEMRLKSLEKWDMELRGGGAEVGGSDQ
jgi:hypothetical protein